MATKTKFFDIFGVQYKTVQFAAIPALDIMANPGDVHPLENLRLTSVLTEDGWTLLDSPHIVNERVRDMGGLLAPRLVLAALLKIVNEHSFGFVSKWKGVKIPKRFTSGVEPESSSHVDPLIASVVQNGSASMRELEEYYSLEDAFKMFDIIVAKGVNEALAQEAAEKSRKR